MLEENGFHRLPNTTGSDPTDTKRNKPEEYAIKYRISEWEIEELTTALIAEYNATPHSGLGYLSPLEAMEQRIQRYFVRTLGEEERENLSFLYYVQREPFEERIEDHIFNIRRWNIGMIL